MSKIVKRGYVPTDELKQEKIKKAHFYLDAPVSNSGRLRGRILELLACYSFEVEVTVINQVDSVLETLENVVTSDAIILNRCTSWINLCKHIICDKIGGYPYVDLSNIK